MMPCPRTSSLPAIGAGTLATSRPPSTRQGDAVVGDQPGVAIGKEKGEGERGLAAPRGAADEDAAAGEADRARMDGGARAHIAGRRTVKRAPRTIGGCPASFAGRVRLSALMRAVMSLDDLPRDRQAKPRVLAEGGLVGTVGVEAFEDALELVGADARAVVLDENLEAVLGRPQDDADAPVLAAEGAGIVDEVVEHLAEPAVMAEDEIGARAPPGRPSSSMRGPSPAVVSLTMATTVVSSWRRSTGTPSCRASSASSREASEMSLIRRFSRRMSCWMMPVSRALASSVLASGSVSTALFSEVSGFFSSWATSAAKLSIASMRL